MGGGIMTDTGNIQDSQLCDVIGVKSIFDWSYENAYVAFGESTG